MENLSVEEISKAYDILRDYNGSNGYILNLKQTVYRFNNTLNNFQAKFILENKDFEPVYIGRIVKIAPWFAKSQQKKFDLDFTPTKLEVGFFMGQTKDMYVFYARYRASQQYGYLTICSKECIWTDFLAQNYNDIQVDFEKYDKIASRIDPNRKLKEEQKTGVKFLLSRKKCILADEMGFGKSLQLTVASLEGNFDNVIIICPASIKLNWKRELMYYTNEENISIIDSINNKTKPELEEFLGYQIGESKKKREELVEEAKNKGKWVNNKFCIVNFDIIDEFHKIPTRKKGSEKLCLSQSPILRQIKGKKSLIIVDEAHNLSNSDSIRYKTIADLIKRGKPDSVYLATGTPITNNPQNLYNILKLIGHPICDDKEKYMLRFCGAKKYVHPKHRARRDAISERFIKAKGKNNWYELSDESKKELQEKIEKSCWMMTVAKDATNLDELKERISNAYLRRCKEDLNGIVKKTVHEMYYDLKPEEKVEYDRLWAEYEAEKEAEAEALKQAGNEVQDKELNKDLLEGAVYRKYISNITVPHTEHIVDILNRRGEKVVVACCYDEELYTLKEYYGDRCVIFNGKMDGKQKDDAIKKFYENDNVMVFIGNIKAASTGINLVNARYMVFNNMSYAYADNQQMEDRIWRITQKRDCHVVYQIFRETQYEHMWDVVLRKKLISEAVIKKESDK